jgi:phosphohistidine phosphatase SixA
METWLLRTSTRENDRAQFLSLEGRRIVRALGNKIKLTEEPIFDRVVSAPSIAAVQTAELFADRVDYVGVVEVMQELEIGVPPQVAAPLLLARGERVLVVGDEPSLSMLGAFLVSRPTFPPLVHGQVSVIVDRAPAWCLRPGDLARSLLLVA